MAKGKESDNDLIWLYFHKESIVFELGNGTTRFNIEANITNPEDMEFHILSEYGRWDSSSWVNDNQTSPCVDAGDQNSDYSNEPQPNGGRVNIGLYGNTAEASKSLSTSIFEYDDNNFRVYPNPTTGKVYFQNQLINNNFIIYSITGVIVKKGIIKTNEIDLSELTKRIYLLKINDDNLNKTKYVKIIKEKLNLTKN